MYAELVLRRGAMPLGHTYTTSDLTGTAIWHPPGSWRAGFRQSLRMVVPSVRAWGRDLPRVLRGFAGLQDAHPSLSHYYLAVLGVEPGSQGRGLGGELMRPVLEICDRDRIPAYLEASTPRSRHLYARHGFEATGTYSFPDGPTVWLMWREPVSSRESR